MASGVYDKAREAFLEGSLSWTGDTVKAVLVDTAGYSVNLATDQFLSDIPAADRVSTSPALTGKTATAGVADAADTTLSGVTGDESEAVVIVKDTGNAATSPLIVYIDNATSGLPVTPNGGDINIIWSNAADKIFKL